MRSSGWFEKPMPRNLNLKHLARIFLPSQKIKNTKAILNHPPAPKHKDLEGSSSPLFQITDASLLFRAANRFFNFLMQHF